MEIKLSFTEAFRTYIKSAFPLIVVPTTEVDRATQELAHEAKKWNEKLPQIKNLANDKSHLKINGYVTYTWDCINGWRDYNKKDTKINGTEKTPHLGMRWLISNDAPAGIYVMQNAHMFFQDQYTLPELVQYFREHYELGRLANRHLFLVGDSEELPPEIQPLCVMIDFPLPEKEVIQEFIEDYSDGLNVNLDEVAVEKAAEAATGMTLHEVESAVCVAVVQSKGKTIDRDIVFAEKAKAVKRSGLLEHLPIDTSMKQIGGLNNFKNWLKKVAVAFQNMEQAREYGLPMPKGCLVAGVSGTGKSACAKATADLFDVPLFRLDIGRVFGGLVGETERKTRQLIQLMEAVAPCVVLIDEIEKALAGLSSSDATDSGVTARLMGNLLYWLQEKTAPVYIIATANEVGKLPPEMLRKGRFDELFFVDLPTESERKEILRIHIEKLGRKVTAAKFRGWEKLAGRPTTGYTGAELEAVVKQGGFDAFSDPKRPMREFTAKDIAEAIKVTVPLVQTKGAEIEKLRKWASNKARMANIGESVKLTNIPKRKTPSLFIENDSSVKALSKRSSAGRSRNEG